MVKVKKEVISPVSNDAAEMISMGEPYIVKVKIRGVADYLYHRWSNEAVAEKAKAPKGSKSKKTDDVESYVYRDENGMLSIPGEQMRMSLVGAAKFKQDPRSPRKSAMDLYKAGIVVLTNLCSVGLRDWDYMDQRRVLIQRNGITRNRPALRAGWEAEFDIMCNLPEYISTELLNDTICSAGKLCGIGDFRPTFGRYQLIKFEIQ